MTIFIRLCIWITVTLFAALASIVIGILMSGETRDRDAICFGAAIVAIMTLGGSLTVNLIQAGYI